MVGDGKTYSFYDKIFKVRDKYESYIDTATLQPYKFVRNVYEGGYKKYENIAFNKTTNTAITNDGVYKTPRLHPGCIEFYLLRQEYRVSTNTRRAIRSLSQSFSIMKFTICISAISEKKP